MDEARYWSGLSTRASERGMAGWLKRRRIMCGLFRLREGRGRGERAAERVSSKGTRGLEAERRGARRKKAGRLAFEIRASFRFS